MSFKLANAMSEDWTNENRTKNFVIMPNFQNVSVLQAVTFEPPHDKTNKMTMHPAKTRSAWAFMQTDQSSLCAEWVVKDPSFLHA